MNVSASYITNNQPLASVFALVAEFESEKNSGSGRRELLLVLLLTGQTSGDTSILRPAGTKPSSFLRWQFEINQIAAETACFHRAEDDPHGHPNSPDDFCGAAEIQPQQQADEETEKRRKEVR